MYIIITRWHQSEFRCWCLGYVAMVKYHAIKIYSLRHAMKSQHNTDIWSSPIQVMACYPVQDLPSNPLNPKTEMFLVSSCSWLGPVHWRQVLSRVWRCRWSCADRRCSNYICVINKVIANLGAAYIRGFTLIHHLRQCCLVFVLFLRNTLHKGSVMWSFDVSLVVSPNKLLIKKIELPVIWGAMTLMWHPYSR